MHSRRRFFKIGVVTAASTCLGPRLFALPDDPRHPALRLAFFSDVHARPEPFMEKALAQAASAINQLEPDLIIGGGDGIHGGFRMAAGAAGEHWDLYRSFLSQLKAPTCVAVGNHDLVGAEPEDGSAPAADARAEILELLGRQRSYFRLDHGGWTILVLDSVEILPEGGYRGWVDAAQLQWIEASLATLPADAPILLVTHVPLRTTFAQHLGKTTDALEANHVVGNADAVLKCFTGRNLPLVLQGHLHVDECIQWNQTTYLMGGAVSGSWWRGPNLGTPYGFQSLSAEPAGIGERSYKPYTW